MSENIETQQVQDDEISLLDLLQTVVDNLRLIVFGSLGAGLFALGLTFFIPPTYTAQTQFLPPQQQQSSASALIQSLGSMGGLAAAASGLKNPADQYIAFMKTQSLLDAMVERFSLQDRYESKFKFQARDTLLANTKIQAGKDSIIKLEVNDRNPQFAADLANGYVSELQKLMGRLSLTEAQQRRAFFENKLVEAKADLSRADKLLRSTGISQTTLKSSPLAAVEMVARLKGAITSQEIRIGSMRGYLTDSAPEIKQALNELNILREQLFKAEKDDTTITVGKLEDSYVERYRDYKYKETLFELFAKQYELARVDEAREGAVIQIIDRAQSPERKSKPQKAFIAIAVTLVSLFVFLLFVFIRKSINNMQSDPEIKRKMYRLKDSFNEALGRA